MMNHSSFSILLALLVILLSFGLFTNQTLLLSTFTLSIFFTLSLNYWLIPGGFAWRNYNHRHHHDQDQNSPAKLIGPAGWPIFGTLPQMGSHFHRKLASLATSFQATKLMSFSLGATRMIISSHPETAKEILCGPAFSDRPIKKSASLLMFERAIGFAPSGTYWRHLRRIAANCMFSPKRISSLEPLRRHVVEEMLGRVWEEMGMKGVVEVRGILQSGSLRNVMESVFGSGLGLEREKEVSDMVREGYELIEKFNWEDFLPLRFLDFYGVKRKCNGLAAKVGRVIGEIVSERKSSDDNNTKGVFGLGGNDFLSALLSLPVEDRLSDSDMVAVLWEMIFRGTDTVAILLEWIMARMALHQDIQAKIQQEINTCVDSNRHVRDSDIPNLPYLQAVVKEVLRMHPPGPLLSWARLAIHDVHVGKVFIPAGTTAMVNMWAITHNPYIWKDPFTFRPERFIEEDVSIMGSDLRLAPFGSGRRVCPGKALGLATVQLWLARFLQEFKWIPAQPTVDLSECLKLSLEMKKPLACRVIRK